MIVIIIGLVWIIVAVVVAIWFGRLATLGGDYEPKQEHDSKKRARTCERCGHESHLGWCVGYGRCICNEQSAASTDVDADQIWRSAEATVNSLRVKLADAQREIERLTTRIGELNQEVLDERALTQKIAEGLDPDKGGDEPYRLLVEIEKQNAALREENERLKNLDYLGAHKDALAIAQREISVLRGKASFWECREDETSANLTKMREKYADAQREIERLKAAAWATLTIADMTVPQIVAMKQENAALRSEVEAWRAAKDQHVSDLREMDEENAALRRALAEAKQAIADFLAGEDEAIVHLKEMGVVKLHEQFPLVDALRRALAGKEE